ncbi:hypothetical protein [Flaviaesturariibacter flavus]|nr:hypothetical protein [Flaviaesturariibacter flavus]
MKAKLTVLLIAAAFVACRTSKQGCPGTSSQGPKYKSSKFEWYKGS